MVNVLSNRGSPSVVYAILDRWCVSQRKEIAVGQARAIQVNLLKPPTADVEGSRNLALIQKQGHSEKVPL